MFDFEAIWSTRYWDMLFPSESERQRMVTLFAWLAKKRAACPAELPAPTMCTSRPCVAGASLRTAP